MEIALPVQSVKMILLLQDARRLDTSNGVRLMVGAMEYFSLRFHQLILSHFESI